MRHLDDSSRQVAIKWFDALCHVWQALFGDHAAPQPVRARAQGPLGDLAGRGATATLHGVHATLQDSHCHLTGGSQPHYGGVTATLQGVTATLRGDTATFQGDHCHITGDSRHLTGGALPHCRGSVPHYRGVTATLQGGHCHLTGGALPHYRRGTATQGVRGHITGGSLRASTRATLNRQNDSARMYSCRI